MSYFSHADDQSLSGELGCGSGCNCGPCKSGFGGFDEWYEREEPDGPAQVAPPPQLPTQTPSPARPERKSVKSQGRPRLGYYGPSMPQVPAVGPAPLSGNEQGILQEALRRGIRNPRQLSNIIFFARHPSRRRRPLQANELELIAEWRQIRERVVLPSLRLMFGQGNGAIEPGLIRRPRRRIY